MSTGKTIEKILGTSDNTGINFVKSDQGKLRWSLMPWTQLKEVVKVLMIGAAKYSDDNWHKASDEDVKRYKDALSRHVIDWLAGEKKDPETGLSHLAHAICNCLFLMYYDNRVQYEIRPGAMIGGIAGAARGAVAMSPPFTRAMPGTDSLHADFEKDQEYARYKDHYGL